MKKLLSLLAIGALLIPSASMFAQEPVSEQKKELSSWTGGFLSSIGRAIKKREYKKLPEIVSKYKKTATGIGALIVLGAVGVMVKLFSPEAEAPRTPSGVIKLPSKQETLSEWQARKAAEHQQVQRQQAEAARQARRKEAELSRSPLVTGVRAGQPLGGQPSSGFRYPGQRR